MRLLRPKTVAIFKTDPTGAAGAIAKVTAFLLTSAIVADVPGRFRFDLVHQHTATKRYTVTRNPVERIVADNRIREPIALAIRGSVSATPLSGLGPLLGSFGSLVRRDLMAVEQLELLADSGEPLIVVTPSKVYGSMSLDSFEQTHAGGNKVDVSLSFTEIEIVSPLAIVDAVDINAVVFGASSGSNMGAQPVDPFVDPGVSLAA